MSRRFGGAGIRRGLRSPYRSAAYDPSTEAGVILDMWAESGVTEAGTGVSSWVSGVGGHDFVQATDANRPTYESAGLGGKPSVLHVAANGDRLVAASGPSESAGEWTLIAAVGVVSLAGTNRYLLDFASGRLIFLLHENPASDIGHLDSGLFRGTAGMQTGANIYTWHLTVGASGAEYFRGETSLGTQAYAATALGGAVGLGAHSSSAVAYVDARIGRMMLLSGVDASRTGRIRDWMSSHYGIAL